MCMCARASLSRFILRWNLCARELNLRDLYHCEILSVNDQLGSMADHGFPSN